MTLYSLSLPILQKYLPAAGRYCAKAFAMNSAIYRLSVPRRHAN